MKEHEWYEDDRPSNLEKYENMSNEEIEAEINRIEEEHRRQINERYSHK